MEPLYTVKSVSTRTLEGITEPRPCTLSGIAKFDSPESEHCVYNEYVALRLGRLLNVPLADGVLSIINDKTAYVSLKLFSTGKALLDPLPSQFPKIAHRYPVEAAALIAFDILIGNYDRHSNFWATLVSQPAFRAFDHSQALLEIGDHPPDSITRLASDDLIVKHHPFYGLVDDKILQTWVNRLSTIDKSHIHRCCYMMHPINAVTVETQEMLTEAIWSRCKRLPDIINNHKTSIHKDTVPKPSTRNIVRACVIMHSTDGQHSTRQPIGLIASDGTHAWFFALENNEVVEIADIRTVFADLNDDGESWIHDEWAGWFTDFLTNEALNLDTFHETVRKLAKAGTNIYATSTTTIPVLPGETSRSVVTAFAKNAIISCRR